MSGADIAMSLLPLVATAVVSVGASIMYYEGEKKAVRRELEILRAQQDERRAGDREYMQLQFSTIQSSIRRLEKNVEDLALQLRRKSHVGLV